MINSQDRNLKNAVKGLILQATIIIARLMRKVPMRGRAYYVLPPADPGSLGDQALTQAVQNWAATCDGGVVRQVLIRGFRPQPLQYPCGLPLNVNEHSFLSQMQFIFALIRARAFFVLGADVLDGRHVAEQSIFMLRLCELSAKAGLPVTVLGSSFSEHPRREVVECIRNLPDSVQFNLRDRVSHARFKEFTGRQGKPVADLAFLLEPDLGAASAKAGAEWASQQRREGHKVVGVNINVLTSVSNIEEAFEAHGNDMIGTAPFEAVLARYAEVLSVLGSGEGGCRFLLIPHDLRSTQSDFEALQKLQSKLPQDLDGKTFCLGEEIAAWEVKALVQECDLVLTARMHLAIAALGMGVPVVCLSYVGKFQGLLDFFNMSEFCFDSEEDWSAVDLVRKIEIILGSLPEFQERISRHLPDVQQMALRNFDC